MPKMKTNSAVKKRFRRTASGNIKKASCGRRHHAWAKTAKRVRSLRRGGYVSDADFKHVSNLLPQ